MLDRMFIFLNIGLLNPVIQTKAFDRGKLEWKPSCVLKYGIALCIEKQNIWNIKIIFDLSSYVIV